MFERVVAREEEPRPHTTVIEIVRPDRPKTPDPRGREPESPDPDRER